MIATATHDTASAVAAMPGLDAASAYISSGTWSLVGIETAQPILSEQARALNFTNEGGVEGTIRFLKTSAGCGCCRNASASGSATRQAYAWARARRAGRGGPAAAERGGSRCAGLSQSRRYAGGDTGILPPHRAARTGERGRDGALLPGEPGAEVSLGAAALENVGRPEARRLDTIRSSAAAAKTGCCASLQRTRAAGRW